MEGNQVQTDSRKTFTFTLTTQKNLDRGPGLEKRTIARDNFLSEWPIYSTGQTFNYETSALLVLL